MAVAIAHVGSPRFQARQPQAWPPERHLTLVTPTTRRTLAFFVAGVIGLFLLMAVAIGFQAVIASQQLKIDHVSAELRLAKLYQDQLRQQRADLLAPDYLRVQAGLQGMSQGLGSRFAQIPQDVVAQVVISTSKMDKRVADPKLLSLANPLASLVAMQQGGANP